MIGVSLATLRAHLARLVATALAIVIAVGFVTATLVLNESVKASVFRAVAEPFLASSAVVTTPDTGDHVPLDQRRGLVEKVRAVPGVAAVATDPSTFVQVRTAAGKGYRYGELTGLAADPRLRWQTLTAGRLPAAPGEVALGDRRGLAVGTTVTILVPNAEGSDTVTRTAMVTGLVDMHGAVGLAGSDSLFVTDAQARAWRVTGIDAIRVAADAGISDTALRDRLGTTLDTGGKAFADLQVRTGDGEAEHIAGAQSGGAAGITIILLVFAAVAVLVCALVIANTFAVLLAQRTRELALLRCVGATARQLRRGVLAESAVIGLVSAVAGVVAGIGTAALLGAIASRYDSPIPLTELSVPVTAVIAGLALGLVVTVVAAYLPARRATRVAPLAALRPMDAPPLRSRAGLVRRLAGVVLLIPSALVLGAGAVSGQLILALPGGLASFVAVVLLARWVVPPVVHLTGRLIGPGGGVPGRLAAANSIRNPQRTATTATALIIGVTLTTTMVVGASSSLATSSTVLDDHFPTDVAVLGDGNTPLPAGLVRTLATVPHVAGAAGLREAFVTDPRGDDTLVYGVDDSVPPVVRSATGAGLPSPGTVSVAEGAHWGAEGSTVTLRSGRRSVALKVHLVQDDTPPRLAAADLAELAPKAGLGAIWLRLDDGISGDDRGDALDAIGTAASDAAPQSFVQGAALERDSFDRIITTLLLLVTGLLAVAVVIAIIGVGNTLALSVVERRQESGLLRALGLSRNQLRGMLLWEAVLIAGVATVLGVALGCVYGALGTSAAFAGAGPVTVDIPWGRVVVIVLVATAAGALASVLPGRRAARIPPVAALAE